jgi:hypothetical protein
MVDGALAAYAGAFSGSGTGRIVWTRDLFIVASDPGKSPTEVLDVSHVSGDDRFLIYGPYIQLPPGSWTARVLLGLSRDAAGYTFVVDAYAGKRLANSSFQPLHGGVFAPEITFSIDEANGPGLEIRVLVGSDNAKGQLAFGKVVLSPVAISHPNGATGSQDDFLSVLAL